jgi:GT2 family glycosyltransferase
VTEPTRRPDEKVLLAYVHPGTVRAEFMASVLDMIVRVDSPVDRIFDMKSGPGLTISRNKVATAFLQTGLEWLWMVDTDMVFSRHTLPALMAHADPDKVPILGALCQVQNSEGQVVPTLYEFLKDGPDGVPQTHYMSKWEEDSLIQVASTGCACLLVHRSVFDKISIGRPEDAGHWFAEMIIGDQQLGEDMAFCVRAALCGMPVHVHSGIKVGHMKATQLGEVNP